MVEIAARPALSHGCDGLEDPAVEAHGVTARAERYPVEVDGCRVGRCHSARSLAGNGRAGIGNRAERECGLPARAARPGRAVARRLARTVRTIEIADDRSLVIVERPSPEPGSGQVALDIAYCGICGSDLHFRDIPALFPAGTVPGHEMSGSDRRRWGRA